MPPEVLAFLRDYAKWLDAGAPQRKPFLRNYGLCQNGVGLIPHSHMSFSALFGEQGMVNDSLPFNASWEEYIEERGRSACHINPARVAWVRRMIEENKEP